jgi:hypothetical protein
MYNIPYMYIIYIIIYLLRFIILKVLLSNVSL